MFDKMCSRGPESKHSHKKRIPYKFRIFRMMTTIWYNVVLDQEIIDLLQHAMTDQMDLIHQSIVSHMIYEGPRGDIEDVKTILSVSLQTFSHFDSKITFSPRFKFPMIFIFG